MSNKKKTNSRSKIRSEPKTSSKSNSYNNRDMKGGIGLPKGLKSVVAPTTAELRKKADAKQTKANAKQEKAETTGDEAAAAWATADWTANNDEEEVKRLQSEQKRLQRDATFKQRESDNLQQHLDKKDKKADEIQQEITDGKAEAVEQDKSTIYKRFTTSPLVSAKGKHEKGFQSAKTRAERRLIQKKQEDEGDKYKEAAQDRLNDAIDKEKETEQIRKVRYETAKTGKEKFLAGFKNKFSRMFGKIDMMILKIYSLFARLDAIYIRSLMAMYIPRLIFFIIILVVFICSFFSIKFDYKVHYWIYSILKFLYIGMITIACFFVIAKTSNTLVEKQKAPTNEKLKEGVPFHILLGLMAVSLLPYLYDLIAIMILIGIEKAYYIVSCAHMGKITHWPLIDGMNGIFYTMAFACFIFTFIAYKFRPDWGRKLSFMTPMGGSLIFIISTLILNGAEDFIANNFAHIMKMAGGVDPDEECPPNNEVHDKGFNDAMNIMINVVLWLVIIVVSVIQIIPFFGLANINMNLRISIGKLVDKVMTVIT